MSLFERLNNKRYDLQEAIDDKGNITPEPGDIAKEKSILRNIKKKQVRLDKNQKKIINTNTKAGDKLLQDINKKLSASTTKGDQARALYGTEGGSTEGAAGAGETFKAKNTDKTLSTKQIDTDKVNARNAEILKANNKKPIKGGKTVNPVTAYDYKNVVKQSEVSKQAKEFTKKINKKRTGSFDDVTGEGQVKYPKNRKDLIAKRKEYGIDRKGNISDAGVKRYAQKTKQLSSGSNLPVTPTQKELDLAKKRAVGGTPVKNKAGKVIGTTTGKYGGKLSRKRPSNAPSLAQIKAKIDAKNPTYKSPLTGGQLPNIGSPESQVKRLDPKKYKELKKLKGIKSPYYQGTVSPDGTITPKLPKKVLVKTPKSIAFPQGLKPIDTKTKEGEKIARKITKKFVTDKELLTGEKPKQYKPPVNNKSKNVFSRIKGFAKKFHQKMTQNAGFRKTSGSGRYKLDSFGIPARDINRTRHIYKNTIRGNTFRLLNKALPGHYKTLAAAGLIAYGLSNRGKEEDGGKGNNVATPKNPYAGKKFKNVTGTLKLGDGNKK